MYYECQAWHTLWFLSCSGPVTSPEGRTLKEAAFMELYGHLISQARKSLGSGRGRGTSEFCVEKGSSKESVGKTRMSFSLFNQDTDLKKSPSPFPLPLEREFFSPWLSGHTPPLPERSTFFSLSWGRGKGEGPFPRHGGGTEQRSETGPRKAYGFQTFKMLQVALYHALGNLPESEFTHEFF